MTGLCLLLLALLGASPGQPLLTLEARAFDGPEEVTAETRMTVHRAGDRGEPVARTNVGDPEPLMKVPPGLYDAQAVRERHGRVVGIRWAHRLVVMPYPDEAGHHLEVINFAAGYGALQIRRSSGDVEAANFALIGSGERGQPAPVSAGGRRYVLFAVPAGRYDLQITEGSRATWFHGIEVPLDRTRLWIVP